VDKQAPVQGGVKADKYYNMLLAVNGVNATLLVDNTMVFTHTYQPRIEKGVVYGLNWGMVGVGSDNSRGAFDNIRVQVLPPQITFDTTEDFSDGVANLFSAGSSGAWSVNAGRYDVTPPAAASGMSLLDLGPDHLRVSSYLELSATLRTGANGLAGYVFDRYGDQSFKFVAIDDATNRLVIGHYTQKSGVMTIDASIATPIAAGTDYTLSVSLKGTTVSASLALLNAAPHAMVGFAFNATTVDGNFGLLAKNATASFDNVRIKTDDPAFAASGGGSLLAADASAQREAVTLTQTELDSAARVAISQWIGALGDGDARLAGLADVRLTIGDLPGAELGRAQGRSIVMDADAGGSGWSMFDLQSAVAHELGHVLGLDHDDASRHAVMADRLEPGVSYPNAAEPASETGTLLSRPAAAAMPQYGFDLDGWRGAKSVAVNWQGSASDGWAPMPLYAPPVHRLAAGSSNFVDFVSKAPKSEGFDSLGRALLGKGKINR
jgi:hypothetical protein